MDTCHLPAGSRDNADRSGRRGTGHPAALPRERNSRSGFSDLARLTDPRRAERPRQRMGSKRVPDRSYRPVCSGYAGSYRSVVSSIVGPANPDWLHPDNTGRAPPGSVPHTPCVVVFRPRTADRGHSGENLVRKGPTERSTEPSDRPKSVVHPSLTQRPDPGS